MHLQDWLCLNISRDLNLVKLVITYAYSVVGSHLITILNLKTVRKM